MEQELENEPFIKRKNFPKNTKSLLKIVIVCLLVLVVIICIIKIKDHHSRTLKKLNAKEIDDFFASLNYSSDQLLVFHGEPVISVKREGKFVNDDFIVVSRNFKSLENGQADICVINSIITRTYPGSLLYANSRLVDNNPDLLVLPRNSVKYNVDLPGMSDDGNFNAIPTYSDYSCGLNVVINDWFERYSKSFDIVAKISSRESLVYSQDQLRVQFGPSIMVFKKFLNINFDAIASRSQLTMLYEFKQIFYTVRAEFPTKPSELFDYWVSKQDLIGKNVSESNPLVFVDTVAYGRTIFLKLETTSTSIEAELILRFGKEDGYHKLKNLNYEIYVMGGGAKNHIDLIKASNIKEVKNIIAKYAEFSRTNPGILISYSTEFVKDQAKALVRGITDYVETQRTECSGGSITLSHYGSYVAQFYLYWIEFSYNKNGDEVSTEKSWYKNGWDLTSGFSETINFKGNVKSIAIMIQECTGLAWEWWRKILDLKDVPLIKNREIQIKGWTLGPEVHINPPI